MDPTIWVAIITGVFGIGGALLAQNVRKRLGEVHHEVKNSHGSNLRDDIDRILQGLSEVRGDIADLRTELYHERHARVDLGWQLDRLVRQHRED